MKKLVLQVVLFSALLCFACTRHSHVFPAFHVEAEAYQADSILLLWVANTGKDTLRGVEAFRIFQRKCEHPSSSTFFFRLFPETFYPR